MKTKQFLAAVFLFIMPQVVSDCVNVTNCCTCDVISVTCSFCRLERLPENIPQSTGYLDLSGNNIDQIDNMAFGNLSKLQSLDLSHNQIKRIDRGMFSNLRQLKTLDLSDNRIESVGHGVFTNMTQLRRLDLSNNLIKTMERGSFTSLSQLRVLNLDQNEIQQIENGTFTSLTGLRVFILRGNTILCDFATSALENWATRKNVIFKRYKCQPEPTTNPEDTNTTRELERLQTVNITTENAKNVSKKLVDLTKESNILKVKDVNSVSQLVENVIESNATLDNDTIQNIVESLGSLVDVKEEVLVQSEQKTRTASKIVKNIEKCAKKLSLSTSDKQKVVMTKTLAIAFVKPDQDNTTDVTLKLVQKEDSPFGGSEVMIGEDSSTTGDSGKLESSVVIPASVVKQYPGDIYLIAYENDKLFKAKMKTSSQTKEQDHSKIVKKHVLGKVIAVGVTGNQTMELKEPLKLKFLAKDGDTAIIHIWEEREDGKNGKTGRQDKREERKDEKNGKKGTGNWIKKGVNTTGKEDNYIVGTSNRMGHFALLMDVHSNVKQIDVLSTIVLNFISILGCVVSITGLVITLVTYVGYKQLRKSNSGKILVNLSSALLMTACLYLMSSYSKVVAKKVVCKVTAGLLHYTLLATWCWMLVEAYCIYKALVKVFNSHVTHLLLKSCLFAWGSPIIIVAITWSNNKYTDDNKICWLQRSGFYWAFLAPVCLILILNLVTFSLVLRQLCYGNEKLVQRSKRVNLVAQVRGATGLTVLLGLTWIFAFFAIGDATVVFTYLFTLLNSFQGLFVFVFHCLLKPDVRKAWMKCLPCCPTDYVLEEWSGRKYRGDIPATSTFNGPTKEVGMRSRGSYYPEKVQEDKL